MGRMATYRCPAETFAISRPRFLNWYRRPALCPLGRCWTAKSSSPTKSGHADFGALQQRLTVARRTAGKVAQQRPAVLAVFDVLELGGVSLMELPLRNRRKRLEDFLPGLHPCLQLVAQTRDLALAQQWLALLPALGGRSGKEIGRSLRAGAARLGEGKAPAHRGLRSHLLSRPCRQPSP